MLAVIAVCPLGKARDCRGKGAMLGSVRFASVLVHEIHTSSWGSLETGPELQEPSVMQGAFLEQGLQAALTRSACECPKRSALCVPSIVMGTVGLWDWRILSH